MSTAAPSLCRLCIQAYTDCKSLFDELGQGNEVYEMTVKYFDPMVSYQVFLKTPLENYLH